MDRNWIKQNAPSFSGEGDIRRMGDLSILHPAVLVLAQSIRDVYRTPILILDGASPRKDPKSAHPQGQAIDIAPMVNGSNLKERIRRHAAELLRLYYVSRSFRPKGLGIYPAGRHKPYGYLHIDILDDPEKRPAQWMAFPEVQAEGANGYEKTDSHRRTGRLIYNPLDEPLVLRSLATTMECGECPKVGIT